MIAVKNISRKFRDKNVLIDISFDIEPNKVTSIISPNGMGKTTLISIIANLLYPNSGKVIFDDNISNHDIFPILSGEKNLYAKNTVYENVIYSSILRGLKKREIEENIVKYSKLFPLYESIKNRVVEELSFGQKRLTSIFSGIVSEAKCFLLDEPTEGLDLEHKEQLKQIIIYLKQERTIILTSHDHEFLASVSDKNLFLLNGKIAEEKDVLPFDELLNIYRKLYKAEDTE